MSAVEVVKVDGRWRVRFCGVDQSADGFDTEDEAIATGERLAKKFHATFRVRTNGGVRETNRYTPTLRSD